MIEKRVGLIGAASFVGERLRLLLEKEGYRITAFSRRGGSNMVSLLTPAVEPLEQIENWICLAPIWTLPENFHLLEKHGAKRLVALSSTSRFSKKNSPSLSDRELASQLIRGEEQVLDWAHSAECLLVILQPTLIYGLGKDRNVTEIARFVQRFGFFPLFGQGRGLRQPVHVDDVAAACCSALQMSSGKKNCYILSGQEVLSYRTMVERIFVALGRKPLFLRCPLWLFDLAVRLANLLPSFKGLTTEMAVRMDKDQNFDNTEAKADLGFRPRPFHPLHSDCTDRS
ncbi:MAG: NAD-dependent epimerase/dehydratase family protein [Proteobacteria bacterium]|nr:NAD-dependent epimerase/dehydratase family protein [Pseudomonadota bacterium]